MENFSSQKVGGPGPLALPGLCYVKFKQTNTIYSPSKNSQSTNAAWRTCEKNGKSIYNCFFERKIIFGCSMKREKPLWKKNHIIMGI